MPSILRPRRPTPAANSSDSAPEVRIKPEEHPPTSVTGTKSTNANINPSSTSPSSRISLLNLPTEIHLAISKHLIYPDALSLKHTSSHFYHLVDTGVALKVEWLVERRSLHLDCPNDKRCDLGSDLRFCRGSVPLLMQRRRQHIECESRPGIGCLVFGTRQCVHRREKPTRWQRLRRAKLTLELWWVLAAVIPLLMYWIWEVLVEIKWQSVIVR